MRLEFAIALYRAARPARSTGAAGGAREYNGSISQADGDNYIAHQHPEVQAWLAKRPRFVMQFMPASSSWLNLSVGPYGNGETWWSACRRVDSDCRQRRHQLTEQWIS